MKEFVYEGSTINILITRAKSPLKSYTLPLNNVGEDFLLDPNTLLFQVLRSHTLQKTYLNFVL
jgi:hypothetical protein